MKKIIPVLSLCIAAITICITLTGLITVSLAVEVSQVGLVAIPTVIIGGVVSAISAPVNFIFKRDKLCLIAFYIQLFAFIVSAVSITVWLVAV